MLCSKKCGQAAILARVKPPPLGPAGRLVGLVGHERSHGRHHHPNKSHPLVCQKKLPSWLVTPKLIRLLPSTGSTPVLTSESLIPKS